MTTKRLTDAACRRANKPKRYAGEHGLALLVKRSASGKLTKSWVQRLTLLGGYRNGQRIPGRRIEIGLGKFPAVPLVSANDTAAKNYELARDGIDPRNVEEVIIPTFTQAVDAVIELHKSAWKSGAKSEAQWRASLRDYAMPSLGNRPVDAIETADILACLASIWNTKQETARRVRQRLRVVFNWVIASGYRKDNPAGETLTAVLPRHTGTRQHFNAAPYSEVAAAVATIKDSNAWAGTKLAFEFLVLTAARSGEVRLATWDEIDMENAVWVVPAERMKAKREHRVPLSARAVAILQEATELADGLGLVFPSMTGRALSDSTLSKLCRENGILAVPHGFRSSFRDWAAERTNAPRAVMEAALAHVVSNKAEAAYARSTLFDKRRDLMNRWAEYVATRTGNVVQLRA